MSKIAVARAVSLWLVTASPTFRLVGIAGENTTSAPTGVQLLPSGENEPRKVVVLSRSTFTQPGMTLLPVNSRVVVPPVVSRRWKR